MLSSWGWLHPRISFLIVLFLALYSCLRSGSCVKIKGTSLAEGNSSSSVITSTQLKKYHLTARDEPEGGGPYAQNVFRDGELQGKWKSCRAELQMGTIDTNCMVDSQYNDRLLFHFSFSSKQEEEQEWKFAAPEILDHRDEGDVSVDDFEMRPDEGGGSFLVKYNCKHKSSAPRKMFMSMDVQLTESYKMKVLWAKTCQGGRNDLISYGYRRDDKEVAMDGNSKVEVGPFDMTTTIFLELKKPGYSQGYGKPIIESSSSDVSAEVRGVTLGGILSFEKRTEFSVIYECHGHVKATITVKVPIPPFDNVMMSWIKDCGGSIPKGLMIGMKAGSNDVVEDGEPKKNYQSQESNIKSKSKENRVIPSDLVVIPASTASIEFFLTYGDLNALSSLHFDDPIISLSDARVVAVQPTEISGSLFSSQDKTLQAGESKTFGLKMVCLKAGKSVVTVTLPLVKYKNVEFSFVKQCRTPREYTERFYWWDVNAIEDIVFLGTLVAALLCCLVVRRNAETKYQRVSTHD